MAKKNQEPVKPESESSEEETDASSGSEEEELETTLKKSNNKNPSSTWLSDSSGKEESDPELEKTTKPESNSDSSEYESDSDSEPKPSLTPSKRLAAEATKSNAKKPKTETEPENNSSKKVLFQKLWSDEDEIVILNGMIEFQANNNISPTTDLNTFLNYIKKDLHLNFTKKQLQSKIRNIRKKYDNNKGKDKNSMKPHDKAVLEFSEQLWGAAASTAISNGTLLRKKASGKGKTTTENFKKEELAVENSNGIALTKKAVVRKMSSSFGLSNEETLLRIGAELFGGEENIAGSEEWEKLCREEIELTLKELDVKRAKMKLVLDTME